MTTDTKSPEKPRSEGISDLKYFAIAISGLSVIPLFGWLTVFTWGIIGYHMLWAVISTTGSSYPVSQPLSW